MIKKHRANPFWPVLIALFLIACSDSEPAGNGSKTDAVADNEKTAPDCQLVMGWDSWEPYQYITPTGEVAGLDVELIQAAAEAVDCELEFVQDDFISLLALLRDGEVDFIPGATRTEAREAFARFSQPYRDEVFRLWVRRNDQELFADANLESLLANGRRIGFTEGFVYGDEAEALMGRPEYEHLLISARIGDINLLRLVEHDIDAMIEDPFVAASVQRRLGLANQVVALDEVLESAQVRLMFSRKSVNGETVERINRGLATVFEDGTRDRIVNRYRGD